MPRDKSVFYTGEVTLLGQRIAAKYPFLKEIAMMHSDERELYGMLRAFDLMIPEGKAPAFRKFLYGVEVERDGFKVKRGGLLQIVQVLGNARYKNGELTDLALKYGRGGVNIDLTGMKTQTPPELKKSDERSATYR